MSLSIRILAATLLFAIPGLCAGQPGTSGVKLAPYKKIALKNGMTVLLMEQHKVPLISLSYLIRGGTVADPKGKEGLAAITASLLRKGTKTRTADQVSEALDSVGATFSSWAEYDFSSGSAEFMKKDTQVGLEMVADMLRNPIFPEAEVKKITAQRIDGLKAAKDSAQGVIRNYYNTFLFGTHPYGRPTGGSEKSLAAITREDVVAFFSSNYLPASTILTIVGDFKSAEMEKLVAERFGAWNSAIKPARIELPKSQPVAGRRLLLVDKPDATQTFFMVGNVGAARTNPDRVGIQVVNVLFGERFTSMINTALRIKSGLTYGAHASFAMRQVPGPFAIDSFTANATTEKALDLTLEVLHDLHAKGLTEEDLSSAKAYIKGTLPPKLLETGDQLSELLAQMAFYGLPDAEVNDFYAKVDALTLADTRRIIQTYYPEKDLTFVLIGKASEIGAAVKKYAPEVEEKAITAEGF